MIIIAAALCAHMHMSAAAHCQVWKEGATVPQKYISITPRKDGPKDLKYVHGTSTFGSSVLTWWDGNRLNMRNIGTGPSVIYIRGTTNADISCPHPTLMFDKAAIQIESCGLYSK